MEPDGATEAVGAPASVAPKVFCAAVVVGMRAFEAVGDVGVAGSRGFAGAGAGAAAGVVAAVAGAAVAAVVVAIVSAAAAADAAAGVTVSAFATV